MGCDPQRFRRDLFDNGILNLVHSIILPVILTCLLLRKPLEKRSWFLSQKAVSIAKQNVTNSAAIYYTRMQWYVKKTGALESYLSKAPGGT